MLVQAMNPRPSSNFRPTLYIFDHQSFMPIWRSSVPATLLSLLLILLSSTNCLFLGGSSSSSSSLLSSSNYLTSHQFIPNSERPRIPSSENYASPSLTWTPQVSNHHPVRRRPSYLRRNGAYRHDGYRFPNPRRQRQHSSTDLYFDYNLYHRHNSQNGNRSPRYQHHVLHFVNTTRRAVCNDGSPAGYYYRPARSKDSRKWLIFLEGGWYCYNNQTCHSRASKSFGLFSSHSWPKIRTFGGILSDNRNANPLYHDYHNVFIPYCSSDLWTGRKGVKTDNFFFHGSRILHAIIHSLPWHQSPLVERVIFAGSSAGGIGVLLNVDRLVRKLMSRLGYLPLVSGIIDSAWFIDTPAYQSELGCNRFPGGHVCPPEAGLRQGVQYWRSRIPNECKRRQLPGDQWHCFLAQYMYPYLKTPVFIVQSLFDEAQLEMSRVPLLTGGTYDKWAYIQNLGKIVAKSLTKAKGVFAPSCMDHEILTKNNWVHKSIGRVGLVDAVLAWDQYLSRAWYKRQRFLASIYSPNRRPVNIYSTSSTSRDSFGRPSSPPLPSSSQVSRMMPSSPPANPPRFYRRSVTYTQRHRLDPHNNYLGWTGMPPQHPPPQSRFTSPSSLLFTSALTMSKPRTFNTYQQQSHQQQKPHSTIPPISLYHVIDTCGLSSSEIDDPQMSSLCTGQTYASSSPVSNATEAVDGSRSSSSTSTNRLPTRIDNLMPQCNPTCGFLSNPNRLKLVDILALYEVNTDLLAGILGMQPIQLRELDSEQQMRMLFCGRDRPSTKKFDQF